MENILRPFVKWTGGKTRELSIIHKYLPDYTGRYIEPFVGGGAVFFSIDKIKEKEINDKSKELISLYKNVKCKDRDFFDTLSLINDSWENIEVFVNEEADQLLDIYINFEKDIYNNEDVISEIVDYVDLNKTKLVSLLNDFCLSYSDIFVDNVKKIINRRFKRMKEISIKEGAFFKDNLYANVEAMFKSAYYIYIRKLYNNLNSLNLSCGQKSAVFYFIREYCYSSMFRYNKKGEFNVPYGGISYNNKSIVSKFGDTNLKNYIDFFKNTNIYSLDFEDFFNIVRPNSDDFIFLDPPYDTTFNSYSNMQFSQDDQVRLANKLKFIDSKFMLVIKNTDFIYNLYKDYEIIMFDKSYSVNFQNRNNRDVTHLLIKNY